MFFRSCIYTIIFVLLFVGSIASCKNTPSEENSHYLYISSRINESLVKYIGLIEAESLELTIRSSGGDTLEASNLGLHLSKKKIGVEVHDFCHSACAEFILPAASKIKFIDRPLIGFHWSPLMDESQFVSNQIDISNCDFEGAKNQRDILGSRNLNDKFWQEVETRLKLISFKPVNIGKSCPWKIRKFENDFWLPTSKQLQSLWGLKFEGSVCADDFKMCKNKVDNHWSKGKRIVIGDRIYVSKGRT